jgi:hypothetical protein
MKKWACFVWLVLFTVLLCRAQTPPLTPPAYVKLSLNLTKGTTYYQNTTGKVTIAQTVNGQKSNIITNIVCKIAFTVTAVHDTLYTMEARYLNLSLNMQLPTGNMNYSSESPAADDLVSLAFAAFKNQPIDMVMTRTGKLQSLSGIDYIFDKILAGFTQISAEKKEQIKSLLAQSFGDRAFRSSFEMGTVIFPTVPIKKSAFWIIDTQMETARAAYQHTIYELRQITDVDYLIHGNSTITYQDAEKFIETNGVPLRYLLSGFMQADIRVNKATGWVTESRITQTISGNTEIKANPKMPNGMTIPMNMRSDMVITNTP